MSDIGLSEFISKIKKDLKQIQKDEQVFLIDKIELEIQVTVSKQASLEGEVGGEVDLKVSVVPFLPSLKVGKVEAKGTASGELAREDVHTIKLSLTPARLNPDFVNTLTPEQKKKLDKNTQNILFRGDDEGDKF